VIKVKEVIRPTGSAGDDVSVAFGALRRYVRMRLTMAGRSRLVILVEVNTPWDFKFGSASLCREPDRSPSDPGSSDQPGSAVRKGADVRALLLATMTWLLVV
jgi:hypothetical protein